MLLHTPYPFETLIVFGVLGVVLVAGLIGVFAWERRRKLKILEEALCSAAVDLETKRLLLEALMPRRRRHHWVKLGLVAIAVAAGMLLAENPFRIPANTWNWLAINLGVLGLAAVTVPYVVRELRLRRLDPEGEVR